MSVNSVSDHGGAHVPVPGESRGPENHRKLVSPPEVGRLDNGSISPRRSDAPDSTSGSRVAHRSIFRPWKGDGDSNRQRDAISLITSRSGPTVPTCGDAKDRKQRRRSFSFSVQDTPRNQECFCLHQQGGCLCATRVKKQQNFENQQTLGHNGHFSDSEVVRESVQGTSAGPVLSTIASDTELGSSLSRDVLDYNHTSFVKDFRRTKEGEGSSQGGVRKPGTSTASGHDSRTAEREASVLPPRRCVEHQGTAHPSHMEKSTSECVGSTQATWNNLMDTFSEVVPAFECCIFLASPSGC